MAELNILPADGEADLVRRYALTDSQWAQIQPLLPPERAGRGRACKSNRLMLDGILYQLRTGAAWIDLPKCFGRPRCVADRLRLWKRTGVWAKVEAKLRELDLLELLQEVFFTLQDAYCTPIARCPGRWDRNSHNI